ncbi:mannitol-1-phosphate 5-dehydrogenase [Ammoniphilus resinae]|uniref:Mannitol-1-phosphate 5-dehydrogenase n=1 Tax=Ammoniphilus resinae TaxID=861532 RepID=A0ABS4GXG9_9BACL|nr:mannitol-1-phosphate 5-dehydrogenase [Ammoniphilus resinae]MBP1934732.1 mannitol-1-phosphate 5-dehydrogenase [Ammoniphilus resinae]
MLAIHFGAGNIGRGFIGQLLNQAGFEVCFVDVNPELVDEINKKKQYVVTHASEDQESHLIQGVRAINGKNIEDIAKEIATADLVTTAVGVNILPFIAPAIAQGISQRIRTSPAPLNIIACENAIGGSTQLKEHVFERLEEQDKEKAMTQIGFPDAAVDRIVPLQKNEDMLTVSVEPFFEWVVNESQVAGSIPSIPGVTYVPDLTPYIERKLFTVNTGHAVIAYLGYLLGYNTISEAIQDTFVLENAKEVLSETGQLLQLKHGFDKEKHLAYIHKIIERFKNPYISDEVVRVGRSPIRKLSPHDRLVAPAMELFDYDVTPSHLAKGIASALLFDDPSDAEALELQNYLNQNGLDLTITHFTNIDGEHPLHGLITKEFADLSKMKLRR